MGYCWTYLNQINYIILYILLNVQMLNSLIQYGGRRIMEYHINVSFCFTFIFYSQPPILNRFFISYFIPIRFSFSLSVPPHPSNYPIHPKQQQPYNINLPHEIQFIILIPILPPYSTMSTTLKMREKLEQSRRTCLLRKIRFYEYLIGYGNSIDLQKPPSSQNKTANSFFPHINYHTRINTPNSNKKTQKDLNNQQQTLTIQNDTPPAFVSRAVPRTSRREALRMNQQRLQDDGISQLVAKSMTPSTRINAPQGRGPSTQASFVRDNFSTIRNTRKASLMRRSSPRKRTYVGGTHYVKDKSLSQNKPKGPPPRKQSIAPWDIELEYL